MFKELHKKIIILLLLITIHSYAQPLNEKEIKWLNHLKTPLKIGITNIPNQVLSENNTYKGFSIDIFKKIEAQLNIKFEFVYFDSWDKLMKAGDAKEIDIIFLAQKTEERLKLYYFTNSILKQQNKIISSQKGSHLKIEDLFYKKIALIEKSAIHNYISLYFPQIDIVLCKTEFEALEMVENRELDYTITEAVRASYYIKQEKIDNLLIVGDIDYDYNLCIASRNDSPMLNVILSKAVENITTKEKEVLSLKWGYSKDKELYFDREKLIQISLFMLVITTLLIFLYRLNRKLKKSKKNLEELNNTLEVRVFDEIEKNEKQQLILLQQSRLAQMGEILNMISHQWRQPLNTLLLMNEVLVHNLNSEQMTQEKTDEFQKDSTSQIKQMSDTIDNFRNFFQPRKEKSDFLLNDIMKHLLVMINPVLKLSEVKVIFKEEKALCSHGYPNELAQALLNILNNAKDALVENNIVDKKIFIEIKKKNNQIIITIKDNAGGIPNMIIDKVFDPYFSTKQKTNGTGIGLYMSKIIIEKHMKGKLIVQNSKEGAVFTIYLNSTSKK